MSLPAPNLDDLRFQNDLVDEARKRIIHYCPEWTEYNLSDPGITLIELFAWMTELMVYRLNQVPEKNYIKFLELLGLQRQPASSARTELTFWLSVSLPISPENQDSVIVPEGIQVRANNLEEEVVFSTDRKLEIFPPVLQQLRKETEFNKNYLSRLGVEIFYPFNQFQPKEGDTFYLGFDTAQKLYGHILRLNFNCEPTEAVGIRREDPPWVWEVSLGDGKWQEVKLSTFEGETDTTGGLNNPSGSLVLYLPLEMKPDVFHGREAYWVRCRIEQRHPSQGMYTESPRVVKVEATTLGATVSATHALVVENEYLGTSTGDPGQEFTLEHAPVLSLQKDETLLVEEVQNGEKVMVPWEPINTFSFSERYDRHYLLNFASGQILLGPSVRQSDGSVRQYGRVPEHGRAIHFKRYRYGGGSSGNLPVNSLQTLTTSLAYISRVTNLKRSFGGRDQESLEEVKLRARRELQAQKRAVTAQDYEQLVLNFSRTIERVNVVSPEIKDNQMNIGMVDILVVPAVSDSLRLGDLSRLWISPALAGEIVEFLDQYRLLTTHIKISEPDYLGVKVKARIVPGDFSDPQVVASRVEQHLRNFLNPLVPFPEVEKRDQLLEKGWQGWVFGKDLFSAEIFSLIQRVPGVKYVLDVKISSRTVTRQTDLEVEPSRNEELAEIKDNVLWVPDRTLLCSLQHEIEVVDLSEVYEERK